MSNLLLKSDPGKPRILFAITSSLACHFYKGLARYVAAAGFDPILLSSPGTLLNQVSEAEGALAISIPIEREIAPAKDLVSLWRLYRAIRQLRPLIADASTPKAGLLTTQAATLARVPCRVYTLRGLRLETARGLKWAILWAAEWITCKCAHRVVCLSPSLRERAISLKLVPQEKAIVLANGSRGVDVKRFYPRDRHSPEVQALRQNLGIPEGAPVIGFVGRFVKDKGIGNLVHAFRQLKEKHAGLCLLLVGDFESGDPVNPEVRRYIEGTAEIVRPGFVADTAPYYSLMDVLVLPTYREGFPGVTLEAQASGVPVVTTTTTGAVDSVVDGVTGLLVPVGNTEVLSQAIHRLLASPALRACMGQAGRERMERDFRPEMVWQAQVELCRELMEEKARKPAVGDERAAGFRAQPALDLAGPSVTRAFAAAAGAGSVGEAVPGMSRAVPTASSSDARGSCSPA
jgi:glycosyltransferase involved in cell wall biosynthesis